MTRVRRGLALIASAALAASVAVGLPAPAQSASLNVDFAEIDFDYTKAENVYSTVFTSSTTPTLADARCTTDDLENCVGKNEGDRVLFRDVVSVGGQKVDALVTLVSLRNAYVRYFEVRDNDEWYAHPEYLWANLGQTNDGTFSARYTVSFYEGGTYAYSGGDTGTKVTLQNLRVTGIDIDDQQNITFYGATAFTLSNPTTLVSDPAVPGAVTKWSGTEYSNDDGDQPKFQVVATYASWASRPAVFGGSGVADDTATYGLAFTALDFGDFKEQSENVDDAPDPSLSYDLNGGSGTAPASTKAPIAASVTVSSSTPKRAGYAFLGWNSKADGSGTDYSGGDSLLMPGKGLTLYAQWEIAVAPGAVRGLAADPRKSGIVAVSWKAPAGPAVPDDYIIKLRIARTGSFVDYDTRPGTSIRVKGLTPGCSYDVKVSAQNAVGVGDATKLRVKVPLTGRAPAPSGDITCTLPK